MTFVPKPKPPPFLTPGDWVLVILLALFCGFIAFMALAPHLTK